MLEKIGLPPKPAARGSNWVLDASHCQGCASQFTLFNRKHHCRRCGGLFCANCTQQRAFLRGQGEGPVRICGPCKKLEDADRFESRYGHKNRAPRGGSKTSSKTEVDLLANHLIGSGDSPQNSASSDSVEDANDGSYNLQDDECTSNDGTGTSECYSSVSSLDMSTNDGKQESSSTPEVLRTRALEEKKKWLTLKKDGKGEEAMLAFKRGKELERQAEALELSIRRSQRRAAASASITSRLVQDDEGGPSRKKRTKNVTSGKEVQEVGHNGNKQISGKVREEKDDLLSDLKELGWSDADLQDADKKHIKSRSVENEFAGLAAATRPPKAAVTTVNTDSGGNVSSMQVLAHKRRALALKREGKVAEAKEELKKAKIIERQLEEQEMGGGEESDDELAALIQGLDKEKAIGMDNPMHLNSAADVHFDLAKLPSVVDEGCDDGFEVEVSDSDMNDPEMVAALRSMGWGEEADALERISTPSAFERLPTYAGDHISLKEKQDERRHALERNKMQGPRSGSLDEGTGIRDPFNDSEELVDVTEEDMDDPYFLSALRAMGFEDDKPTTLMQPLIASAHPTHVEKATLQQEVLSLKKEALALKRAGQADAAKEELRRAKRLEKELKDMQAQNIHEGDILAASQTNIIPGISSFGSIEEDIATENVDVTEEDLEDPELAKTLKSLGWQDDNMNLEKNQSEKSTKATAASLPTKNFPDAAFHSLPPKKKSEIQKELLGLKRSALKLRREGRSEDAEKELEKARVLEQQIAELESRDLETKRDLQTERVKEEKHDRINKAALQSVVVDQNEGSEHVAKDIMKDADTPAALQSIGWSEEREKNCLPSNEVSSLTKTLNQSFQRTESRKGSAYYFKQSKQAEGNDQSCPVETRKAEQKILSASRQASGENVLLYNFHNNFGEIGLPVDSVSPLFCPPSEGENAKTNAFLSATTGGHGGMDLLTGDEWKPVGAKADGVVADNPLEPNVRATSQSIGIGMPSSRVKQVQTIGGSSGKRMDELEGKEKPCSEQQGSQLAVRKRPTEGKIQADANVLPAARDIKDTQRNEDPLLEVEASSGQDLQRHILTHKKKALALKREGRQVEAKEELRLAKLLEKRLELNEFETSNSGDATQSSVNVDVSTSLLKSNLETVSSSILSTAPQRVVLSRDAAAEKIPSSRTPIQSSAQKNVVKDRMKLQQESLAHKRKALTLRREGKMEEAEAEFELAKSIEKQMEELESGGMGSTLSMGLAVATATGTSSQGAITEDDGSVDDILDPQLLAALKGLGWKNSEIFNKNSLQEREVMDHSNLIASSSNMHVGNSSKRGASASDIKFSSKQGQQEERMQLEEKIKAEKIRAVQLKQSGRRSEALDVLRGAKNLEKKLNFLAS